MDRKDILNYINDVPSPCFVVDERLLERNLEIIRTVQDISGASVLLALKGFAMHSVFPLVRKYLCGTTASSLNEAKLGHDEFGGCQVHACAPAYREDEIDELLGYVNHITFNSFSQWDKYRDKVLACGKKVRAALRVNPEHSEVKTEIYDPCQPFSRLGIVAADFEGKDLTGITGLHFHTLCELNSDSLERTLKVVEKKFGPLLKDMEWVNFGGGHHITRDDYDIELLCRLIMEFKQKYGVQVYLEPGEAVALNCGYLVASVEDVTRNGMDIAVLDTSAATHMPDVIEMPYRPEIIGAGMPGEKPHTYRLGGISCLAGDIIGDYSFDAELHPSNRLVFTDMAHYSMVKTTTFNGINLPSIARIKLDGALEVVKRFGYEDFKSRLS